MITSLTALAAELVSRFQRASAQPDAGIDNAEFNALLLSLCRLQNKLNPVLSRYWGSLGVAPETIQDWTQLPALPAVAFKEFDVTCIPKSARTHCFVSSGSTGQAFSRHFHAAWSLAVYHASLIPWFERHLFGGPDSPCDAIFLTPDATRAPASSLVHMLETVRLNRGLDPEVFAGGLDTTGAWVIDAVQLVQRIQGLTERNRPVLVAGTAFNFVHLMDELRVRSMRLRLPAGSRVMETGGYKGRSRELSREELHAGIAGALGVSRQAIVCEYGMSELSSQAYDLRLPAAANEPRLFRFPSWVRIRVVSPETGREAAVGETGLLHIADLANVASCVLVQTEDLAIRRAGGFELIGRAPRAAQKGCSLLAA